MSVNKNYMDIDEFLNSRALCEDLTFPDSDEDFNDITDPIDFQLSEDQLHEYTASEIGISSDEGQGKSICSETSSENEKHLSVYEVNDKKIPDISNKTGKTRRKREKNIVPEIEGSSKAITSTTWKRSQSPSNQSLATSVEIEGISYAYNLMPTSKAARNPNRRSVPGTMKDEKYWDRRLKNNEAAKRSRDLRRRKEMLVASKAVDLETENEELKAEVALLRERVKVLSKKLHEKSM